MGSGISGLYHNSAGSKKSCNFQLTSKNEKNKFIAEKRKQTIRRKIDEIKAIFKNGKIEYADITANPSIFADKTITEVNRAMKELGYKTKIEISTRSSTGAKLIRVLEQGKGSCRNINQVQFSPGGGIHGTAPYIKFSTTDQGKFKIVKGSRKNYMPTSNDKARVIYTEE